MPLLRCTDSKGQGYFGAITRKISCKTVFTLLSEKHHAANIATAAAPW